MGGRLVRDVIVGQQLVALDKDATVVDAAKTMRNANIGAVIVTDNGRLAGIFTERDAIQRVLAEGIDATTTALSQVMSWGLITVTMDTPVSRVLHIMHENNFRHVPVIDRLGSPLAIVSIRDVLGDEISAYDENQGHPSTEIVD